MNKKEFLKQVEKLDKLIENKLIEKEQWKSIALGITGGGKDVKINGVLHQMDKVQSSGNPQKMADAIDRYIDIETEIDKHVDELIDTKKDVISVIEMLNPIEYDILHKIYIQFLTLYDVAAIYDKSYSWATTIHGRALKNVQKILDERENVKNGNEKEKEKNAAVS